MRGKTSTEPRAGVHPAGKHRGLDSVSLRLMRKLCHPAALLSVGFIVACGGAATTRTVDTPSGSAVSYGAPRDTAYEVEVEPAKDTLVVHVFERSKCSVIPLRFVQREQQTLDGDEVVHREHLGKKEIAGEPQGDVSCAQTYARNVDVSLVVGSAVQPLGTTDAHGTLSAKLPDVLKSAAYGEAPPADAIVRIRPLRARPALDGAKISLRELGLHEQRVDALLAELEGILAKGASGASSAEITRSYELYSQLQDVAPSDPRVRGISARFWELMYGRKQDEATERLSKNLQALDEARELLKTAGDAAIPLYVQAAVNSGVLDARSLEWASLRLISALRTQTIICQQGFDWGHLPSYPLPADARVAAHYLHYGYGDAYARDVTTACLRF